MVPGEILYRCGSFDWVPLLGIWGAIGYTPLLGVAINPTTTPEYVEWRGRRINDNIPMAKIEEVRPMEEYLQVIPSELDIMKQEFKRKNLELEKKIEKLEEEKMYLSLDVDLQKKEVEKFRKEKRKVEEEQDDLKEEYKKAQVSLKRVGLGRSSEQWQKEVQVEKARAKYWERKFQEMRSHNLALEEENKGLKTKVTKLGRSLCWHRNHNPTVELKELKSKVEYLEVALHDSELRIEQLEAQEDCIKRELHQVKSQVRDNDYIIGEAIAQIREIAEYVRDLAVRADALSMMYESVSDKGRELALLLDKIKTLGNREKAYV
ncbi:hypothetical protein V6Z11_A07G211100 [Gossypium hirsutum]